MKESTFFHRYKEIILGLYMIALASFYLYHAGFIKARATVSVNAKLIPQLLGGLVIVLGVLQLANGVKYLISVRKQDKEEGNTPTFVGAQEGKDAIPVILTFAIILGYALTFEWLGFIISSVLCMFCQMWVLTPKSRFKPFRFAAISVIVAVVVYIAFKKGLDLSLPEGVLEGLPL